MLAAYVLAAESSPFRGISCARPTGKLWACGITLRLFRLRMRRTANPPSLKPRVPDSLVQSYRQLADVFHDILSEHSLDNLLERIADTLAELVPHDTLSIYQADEAQTQLTPVLARDKWADKIMDSRSAFGEGITGWAALHREPVRTNQAHLDPRTKTVPGTPPDEAEALITVPLIARDLVKGVLNIYRLGEDASFSDEEFELTTRFADAAALALDNAQIRARLEYQAQTDSLTGLYNHRYFHERLRAELTRANRSRESVAVLMLDIDDFKRVNDVYGHGSGDQVLTDLAELLRAALRGSDVVCRLGGEEFGMIMPSGDADEALALARRLTETLAEVEFGPAGKITISVGISQGPEHAMNPRELVACAEAAMMTAKARGKNQIVLFEEHSSERPDGKPASGRDVRSIAHLKMLQSLAGKLNRLNDVRQIGEVIADELRLLIDYHNCRVSVIEGDEVVPIAFRGELLSRSGERVDFPRTRIGEGITGHVAETSEPLLVGNTLECEFAVMIPGTHMIEESQIAVPLCYGARVIGVIAISKLGIDQFDEDDVRLLEVLAGHASVALENARLYEAQRREADHLKALLEFTGAISEAATPDAIGAETVSAAARILGGKKCALWLPDENGGFRISAQSDYDEEPYRPMLGIALERPILRAAIGDRTEPFLLCAEEAERMLAPRQGSTGPTRARAAAHRRRARGLHLRSRADHRQRAQRRRDPSAARRHLVPGGRRARARPQLREPRGDVRLDRRGAGQRARGERRVHLLPHALDHRHGASRRRGNGLRGRGAEAARARRALPRHRQDRDPDEHPAQAGPAHRPRSARSWRCTRSSASGSSSRSSGWPRCARSSAAATSAGTAPATRTRRPARRSRSRRGSSSSATPSTR